MPTTRPRHLITETDSIAQALDAAARRWPEDRERRSRLLVRLALEGYAALRTQSDREQDARVTALRRTSGALDGVYGPGYLEERRAEWPE